MAITNPSPQKLAAGTHACFQTASRNLEALINMTPTSERRALMTDANIHLMAAHKALADAFGLPIELLGNLQ